MTLSCDPLLDLGPTLKSLMITSSAPMDDRSLEQLVSLDFLSALTRGRHPLDLSGLRELRWLSIDDRPGLQGFQLPGLEKATFHYNQRRLAELEGLPNLWAVKLEGRRSDAVDLRARLESLRQLTVFTSRVESLEGLVAPNLESLMIDSTRYDGELDLEPLTRLPRLKELTVEGPRSVRNLAALAEKDMSFGRGRGLEISEAELSRLPERWRAAFLR